MHIWNILMEILNLNFFWGFTQKIIKFGQNKIKLWILKKFWLKFQHFLVSFSSIKNLNENLKNSPKMQEFAIIFLVLVKCEFTYQAIFLDLLKQIVELENKKKVEK
jgi:hypothetical protein